MAVSRTSHARQERTIFTDELLVPGLQYLGYDKRRRSAPAGMDSHQHAGFELCLISQGRVEWWFDHQAPVTIEAFSWVFTPPNIMHGASGAVLHPCQLFWFQAEVEVVAELFHWPKLPQLVPQVPTIVPAQRRDVAWFTELLDQHRQPGQLAQQVASASVLRLLAAWQEALVHDKRLTATDAVIQAQVVFSQDLSRAVPVSEVAEEVGLSSSQLHRRFVAETGHTPAAWQRRARLAQGQHWLMVSDRSVTDIALTLGFASSQHFAHAFKETYGCTPSQWRQQQAVNGEQ